MAHRRTWRGTIKQIVNGLAYWPIEGVARLVAEHSVSAVVVLNEGPARDVGRTVTVTMSPEAALDWSAEIASHARTARRNAHESGSRTYVAPTGENVTRYVERLVRDFAEDTGVQDDDMDTQVLDLMTELFKIASREDVDTGWLADKARELAAEEE